MNKFSYSENWSAKCITTEIHNVDNTRGRSESNL